MKDIYQKIKDGELELTLFIFQRPHMRDPSLEFELHIGRSVLDNIFEPDPRVCETVTEIRLSFPERWLNIIEERTLLKRIGMYYPNLKSLIIKTQSVYIMQCTPADCCRIVRSEEDKDLPLPNEMDDGILYLKNPGNLFNAGKVNVVYGGKKE